MDGNCVIDEPGKRRIVFPYSKFRSTQRENITALSDFFASKGKKVAIFKGTTGIGKTISVLVAGAMAQNVSRIFYVSTTKNLQEQAVQNAMAFAEANPSLNVKVRHLRGRQNYPCAKYADRTADDCTSSRAIPCPFKPKTMEEPPGSGNYVVCKNGSVKILPPIMCDYYQSKMDIVPRKGHELEIVIMTTAYLLTEALFAGEITASDLIVFDEGSHIESQIVDATALELDEGLLRYVLGYDYPISCNVESYNDVHEFLVGLGVTLDTRSRELETQLKVAVSKKEHFALGKRLELVVREIETIKFILSNWDVDNLVIDKYRAMTFKKLHEHLRIRFLDVSASFEKIMREVISADGTLCLMSATMQSKDYITKTFHIQHPVAYFKATSGWPKSLRPVVLMKGMRLNAKNIDEKKFELFEIIKDIADITSSHGKNLLVHTHSNKLKSFLCEAFYQDERVISHDLINFGHNLNAREAFEAFCNVRGKVLISASMSEGLDFKGDICEIQIIAKVPFPNMMDAWVKRKKEVNSDFLSTEAVLSIEQMIGRIHRTEKDFGLTIILDAAFLMLQRGSTRLDGEAFDNMIGYAKSERIEKPQLVDIVRKSVEMGAAGITNVKVENRGVKNVGVATHKINANMMDKFSKSFEDDAVNGGD